MLAAYMPTKIPDKSGDEMGRMIQRVTVLFGRCSYLLLPSQLEKGKFQSDCETELNCFVIIKVLSSL